MNIIKLILEREIYENRFPFGTSINHLNQDEYKYLLKLRDQCSRNQSKICESLAVAITALDKLSKLGNEPYVGNSIGNDIASEALVKISTPEELF